jgi:CRP/FNR family transcriptional regulator, cyclic AMP receptor protein
MKTHQKQIHIRLTPDVLRKLKYKCAYDSKSLQDFVEEIIARNITPSVLFDKCKIEEIDNKTEILNLFNECPIFHNVDSIELGKLANFAELLRFEKGRIIVREEESPNSLLIVAGGLLKIFKGTSSGRDLTIHFLSRGEIFGEDSLISGFRYSVGAQAIVDSKIVFISKQKFLEFTTRNPQVITKISSLQRERISILLSKLANMVTDKADERVLKVLDELMNKFGNTLCFSHKEIAEMSGITNETASRIMTNLKNRGIISLSRSTIVINSRENLI